VNINYADIIAKANARKESLEAFEVAVQGLIGEINDGGDPTVIEAARKFQQCHGKLDPEAIKLLPVDTSRLVRWIANLLATWEYADKTDSDRSFTPRAALAVLASK
jgi:hypothetical protein